MPGHASVVGTLLLLDGYALVSYGDAGLSEYCFRRGCFGSFLGRGFLVATLVCARVFLASASVMPLYCPAQVYLGLLTGWAWLGLGSSLAPAKAYPS